MESELVSGSLSYNKEVVNTTSLEKIFNQHLPYYLAMGMSADEYWNGSNDLVIAYRKADKEKRKRKNVESWVNGMYTYLAILDNVPILRPFSKAKEPTPYLKEPLPIYKETKEEKIEKAKNKYNNVLSKMFKFKEIHNSKYE